MKKFILISLLTVLAAGSARAQENPEVLQFMRTERSPRGMGLAGAGAASVQSPAFAAFRGAAVIPLSGLTMDAGLAFQSWQPGNEINKTTNIQFGGAGMLGPVALSLGGAWQSGQPEGAFTPSQMLVAAGVAYGFGPHFSLGVNARYARETLAEGLSLGGFSADITAAARFARDFTAVAGVCMLGPQVAGSAKTYPQPTHALAALAWHPVFGGVHAIEVLADAEYYFSGSAAGSFGLEYSYDKTVFLRGGYRLGTGALPSHAAAGLGVQFVGFRVEAAYVFASESLSGGLAVGLGYKF